MLHWLQDGRPGPGRMHAFGRQLSAEAFAHVIASETRSIRLHPFTDLFLHTTHALSTHTHTHIIHLSFPISTVTSTTSRCTLPDGIDKDVMSMNCHLFSPFLFGVNPFLFLARARVSCLYRHWSDASFSSHARAPCTAYTCSNPTSVVFTRVCINVMPNGMPISGARIHAHVREESRRSCQTRRLGLA